MTDHQTYHQLTIRVPTQADVQTIAGIHTRAWQAAYRGIFDDAYLDFLDPEQRVPMWSRMIEQADTECGVWVAERDDQVIGFCSIGEPQDCIDAENTGELYTLYLEPKVVGQGVGHALITRAEEAMRAQGKTQVVLWVLADNARARQFYEAHGWHTDGEEKQAEMWGTPIVEVRYRKVLMP